MTKKTHKIEEKETKMNAQANPLPNGTKVLNTEDGEPGWVVNGFTIDETGKWVEYEVETAYGIERRRRDQFVLMNEIEAAKDDANQNA